MHEVKEEVLFQRVEDGGPVHELSGPESRKYLIFIIDNLKIGIDAEYVVEILNSYSATYLPMMPDYIQGIFNMRGQIIPIMDIRQRLGKYPMDGESLLIVLDYNDTQLGIQVDAVELMMDIPNASILPIPSRSAQKLVSGMCTLPDGSGTMLVLDCEQPPWPMSAVEKGSGFTPMTISEADFKRLVTFIQGTYGIDLTQKRQLITGRLSPAIRKLGYKSFAEFVNHVLEKKENDEITLVLNKLTTNYTFFMREKEHLDVFCKRIIPDIVQRHQRDKCLAIWSAGCSSGEEPYNITMFLYDYLGSQAKDWDTRILATDISAQALTKAKAGVYTLPDTIPPEWKKKYFTANKDGTHTVSPAVRNNVIYQTFNLMDPIRFRRKFDVIFCRNVMIYFDQPTKDALVRRFYDATVPGGYLLISASENLGQNAPYRRLATATFQK